MDNPEFWLSNDETLLKEDKQCGSSETKGHDNDKIMFRRR